MAAQQPSTFRTPDPSSSHLFYNSGASTRSSPSPDALAESADELENRYKIRVVDNSPRASEAASLVQRRYAWRGYSTNGQERRAPDKRITLSASLNDQTIATITAGLDSADGMYVARLYPDEVQVLRDEGRKLCEFTKLAVDESVRSQSVLGAIFHVACLYVIDLHECTDVLIEVNPRHVRFYERMLGFKRVAEERMDLAINAPAVLLRLDLSHCANETLRLGGRRNDAQIKQRSLYPYFFAPDEARQIVARLRLH